MTKKENIHRKKLFNGMTTAEELHRAFAIRQRCLQCKSPAAIKIRVWVEVNDLEQKQPWVAAAIKNANPNGPYIPTTAMTYGQMVLVSEVAACERCQADAEKQAAKAPDWAFVEIDRGPGKDNTVVSVPLSFTARRDEKWGS